MDEVAADLYFRASKERWLLHKKYFKIAVSSTAVFCVPLYNIVMPYLRHCASFVPKIWERKREYATRGKCSVYYASRMRVFMKKSIAIKKISTLAHFVIFML